MHAMTWLSAASRSGTNHHKINTRNLFCLDKSSSSSITLGILSFETAKTMSRLIHLYRSLSADEFSYLRDGAMTSKGVAFLISSDERFLLSLACTEKLEELNRSVNTVSRLGRKCADSSLKRFDQNFAEMCLGVRDFGQLDYASKSVEKLVEKMDKYVKATSSLHATLENLAELEISEHKIKRWKQNQNHGSTARSSSHSGHYKANTDYFDEKINYQRKQVRHYRDVSLWNQTFDQSVGIMTRVITIVYSRICLLFGPYVADLPRPNNNSKFTKHATSSSQRMRVHPDARFMPFTTKSGPIFKPHSRKIGPTRIAKSGPLPRSEDVSRNVTPHHNKKVMPLATESTVGGAGLAQRYANIIIYAERYLYAPTCIDDEARGYLYELLPENLKTTVRGKLWGHWCTRGVHGGGEEGEGEEFTLAEGWREALEEMMTWLAPVAHDTVKWQQERYLEKQRFDSKPTVMLFETLHFADLEKTEVAIVEVLVGLSCIYRYENKRLAGAGAGRGRPNDGGFHSVWSGSRNDNYID